jgi:adenylosuccinate synthase
LNHILGIVKAYTTRVGAGPFTTELTDEIGDMIQSKGCEFGATTGRRRRCGWLDLVVVKTSKRLNSLHSMAITKLDVLTGLETVKICTAYELDGETIDHIPASLNKLARCKPIYEEMPGWEEDLSTVKSLEQLPSRVRDYLSAIENLTGIPISIVSVGAGREETIIVKNPFTG